MYTADHARARTDNTLDERIQAAVENAGSARSASIRVYIEDSFCRSIASELERRGFTDIQVPDICLKGDVRFSW